MKNEALMMFRSGCNVLVQMVSSKEISLGGCYNSSNAIIYVKELPWYLYFCDESQPTYRKHNQHISYQSLPGSYTESIIIIVMVSIRVLQACKDSKTCYK